MTIATGRFSETQVIQVTCLVIVSVAVLVPSVRLLLQSLTVGPEASSVFSLRNYSDILTNPATYKLLSTTFLFSAATAIVSGSFGFIFAWVAARTNVPLRRYMPLAILLPYFVPPTLGAISWILLLSPRNGLINVLLTPIFGSAIFNIYSLSGMVFVESLYAFPIAFMFFHASLVSLNPELEEASAVSGASTLSTLVRTTIPVVMPTIISVSTLLFIIGFESFDVAWFLGYPAKVYTLSIEVYRLTRYSYPPDMGSASAYGVLMFIFAMLLVMIYRRVTSRRERFVTISARGYRLGSVDLGTLRVPAAVLFYLLIFIIGALPILLLFGIASEAIIWPFRFTGSMSFENFRWIFQDSTSLQALENTAIVSFVGAFLVVGLSFLIAYITIRTRGFVSSMLDFATFLPFGFPSIVLAVGFMAALIKTPLYDTLSMLLIAYVVKFLPYGVRNLSNSMLQIHRELEEASVMAGASLVVTLRRVFLPLVLPGLVSAWSLLFIVFGRQFSLPVMLSSSNSEVIMTVLFQEWDAGQFGHVAAYAIVLLVFSFPFLMLARRFVREASY